MCTSVTEIIKEAVCKLNIAGAIDKNFWELIARGSDEVAKRVIDCAEKYTEPFFLLANDIEQDMTKSGWTKFAGQVYGAQSGGIIFKPKLVKPTAIIGELMMAMARNRKPFDCTDQRHAEAILKNLDSFPLDWDQYVKVFPGTDWFDKDNHHVIPCIDKGARVLSWLDLSKPIDKDCMLVVFEEENV